MRTPTYLKDRCQNMADGILDTHIDKEGRNTFLFGIEK